jgi:hypothetical protein
VSLSSWPEGTCRHCGEPIRLWPTTDGGEWMHVYLNHRTQQYQQHNGELYCRRQPETVAEP